LEGLAVALANIDRFIAIIKAAANPVEAKQELMAQAWDSSLVREMLARAEGEAPGGRNSFRPEGLLPEYGMQDSGLYRLSDGQAQEILQMRLQRLTGLEQDKIVAEYKEVMDEIADLLDLLAKPDRVTKVIETELKEVQNEFGQAGGDSGRRSFIEMNATELFTEDLITPTDMVVTLSHAGYMKSQPLSEYRAQKRGGRGKQAATTKDEDWIDTLFVANTHDTILCFSDRGRMYWLKVWEVPQGSRTSRGKPIVNMFPLIEGEKITVILPIKGYQDDQYVFMSTQRGTVKKTRLSDFSNPRKAGIIAVDLDEGDCLVGAAITDGKHDVMLFSDAGKAVRFDENDVRPMGRTARGVRGMNLGEGQEVIAMLVAPAEISEEASMNTDTTANDAPSSVLTATENGFGKRTPIAEYTRHGRGTKGMIAIQTSERNGKVVAAALVSPEDQIMLITTGGVLVRTRVSEIREMGRSTQGVTLINVDEGTHLSGLQRIAESDSDDDADELGEESDNLSESSGDA
jgi:DNA gyrase subunit A